MKLFANEQLTLAVALFITFCANAQTVICPTETNLGTFTCSMLDDPEIYQILVLPDGLEVVMSPPYNMEITGILPQTGVVIEDSDLISFCQSAAREVTRTISIYNDENFNFQYDAGEETGTCTYTITTETITELPTFTTPPDTETDCGIGGEPEITGEPVISDDTCPAYLYNVDFTDSPTLPNCDGAYIIARNWFIADNCGNESEPQTQVIAVLSIPPDFTVPPAIVVPCGTDPMDASVTGDVTDATESCSNVAAEVISTIVDELTLTNTPCAGATTYVVDCSEDDCGAIPPIVTCPAETDLVTVDCNTIFLTPQQVNSLAEAMDIYGIEITGALPQTGVTTIDSDIVFYCEFNEREVTREVIIYNDNNFNFRYDVGEEVEICTFTINIIADLEPPTFIAPPDTVVSCELGTGVEVTGEAIGEALDNCPIGNSPLDITFTDAPPALGNCRGTTIIVRTWKATDNCGNVSEQTQVITTIDDTGPTFTVPEDITVPCGTDIINQSINEELVGFDLCDNADILVRSRIVDDLTQENTPCAGSTTFVKRWGGVDQCGNATTKDQIIVEDCGICSEPCTNNNAGNFFCE